ncbi:MAG: hypothetical protein M3O70_29290, partial [Actinomycetota bacterium]|nr:hypothetical protein [Actinomycetota bacterium]
LRVAMSRRNVVGRRRLWLAATLIALSGLGLSSTTACAQAPDVPPASETPVKVGPEQVVGPQHIDSPFTVPQVKETGPPYEVPNFGMRGDEEAERRNELC